MKVLVTGAGGRIGTHLTRGLLAEGHEVRAFGLADDPRLQALAADGARVWPGDLEVAESLVEAVRGVDAICHLAAALTTHDVSDDRFVDVNLRGTFNVLQAVREQAPDLRRFVYTSSDAVYWSGGDRATAEPIRETDPLLPGSVYGATKVGAELLCRSFWQTYAVPYAVMRPTATADPREFTDPGSVFGRRWFVSAAVAWYESHPRSAAEDALLAALKEVDDGTGKLYALVDPAGGSAVTALGDARDVAAGMRAMIDSPAAVGEAFNVGPAQGHSHRDFVTYLARRLGRDVVEIRSPAARGHWNVSSAKAVELLGYRPQRDAFSMIDEAVSGGVPAHS